MNIPLKGSYLVEHTVTTTKSATQRETDERDTGELETEGSVILCSGAFDPYCGSYSEKTIRGILSLPNIHRVYEAHFLHQDKPGQLDPASYASDLALIYQSDNAPIMIGMSASTWLLTTVMFDASQINQTTDSPRTLLIGAMSPDHLSLLGKVLQPYYERNKMQEKVARHCGHPFAFQNADVIYEWWDTRPAMQQAIKQGSVQSLAPGFGTQMDLWFFKLDTCSNKGKKLFRNFCGGNIFKHKIPKHHRSLLNIPEVDSFLPKYCATNFNQHANPTG